MKAVILNTVSSVACLADGHVLLRRVQHVRGPHALQVVQIAHRLPVTDDNTGTDLEIFLCSETICIFSRSLVLNKMDLLQNQARI